jgi:hypothetical protein
MMKQLRILGLMLMALLTLGSAAAATALAVEPGILTLKEVADLNITQEILTAEKTTKAEANTSILKGPAEIPCSKLWVLPVLVTRVDGKHWTLLKDVDLHLSECQSGGLACNTEKDASGVLLILVDAHFVAFLEGKLLIPGLILLILNAKLEALPLAVLCGGVLTTNIKGAMTAKVVQLSEALTEMTAAELEKGTETKPFTVELVPGLKCDESDKLCKELLEPNPLLADSGEGFKPATEKTQAQKMAFDLDVLWDF